MISDGVNGGFYANWMDALYPYMKNLNLMMCPSAGKQTISWGIPDGQPMSYGYNPTINGCFTCGSPIIPAKLSAIRQSSGFIMIFDCNIIMGVAASGCIEHYWLVTCNYAWAMPHNNGINVGFADGHARWFHYDDPYIMQGANIPDLPQANNGTSPHWYLTPAPPGS